VGGILLISRRVPTIMSVTISPPTERRCELCGRTERWDADAEGWRVDEVPGNVYCIHDWDINGTYAPFEDPVDDGGPS
jgi:hypothetical protein